MPSEQNHDTSFEGEEEASHSHRDRRRWERRDRSRRARKERVLHTRISEHLADDIRQIAEDLRVPVSNLVRNVLEETFSAVERVSDNVGEVIEDVIDEAERARDRIERRMRRRRPRNSKAAERPRSEAQPSEGGPPQGEAEGPPPDRRPRPEFAEVVGWQPLILNRDKACADCGATMHSGDRAFVGLAEGGLSPHALCRDCADDRF